MTLAAIRFSHTFRFATWLALWALLLPALLPLTHHPASLMGLAVPICHVVLGGGNHKQAPEQDKAQSPCPVCKGLGSLAQGFVPPDVVALAFFRPDADVIHGAEKTSVIYEPVAAAWPRAPPFFA